MITPELKVFFAAMTPFVELKFAIPFGFKLGLSTITILIFATAGTLIPAITGLAVADPLSTYLSRKFKIMEKFFHHLFEKTRKQHSAKFNRYGALCILLFVAIPLPGSGASAGAVIAWIFGVDFWEAIALITAGTIISALILLAGTSSIFTFFHMLH